jgi:hypothetical protein
VNFDYRICENLLKEHGIKYRTGAVSLLLQCPRCGKDKKLAIRKTDGKFCCWVCRERDSFFGWAEYALTEVLSLSVGEIKAKLYGIGHQSAGARLEVDLEDFFGDFEEEDGEVEYSPGSGLPLVQYPYDFVPINHPHAVRGAAWLDKKRGVPLEIAVQYGIHYSPLRREVVFPVRRGSSLYGWQGRVVYDHVWQDDKGVTRESPKAMTSKGLPRDQTLMFWDRLNGIDHAVIAEGPISGIKAHLCGGNVVTMGKAVSDKQIEILRDAGIRKLYIGLDPDAAQEIMGLVSRVADMECYQMITEEVLEETGHAVDRDLDLGDLTFEQVHVLFRNAPRLSGHELLVHLRA